jgi:hypothetical protein
MKPWKLSLCLGLALGCYLAAPLALAQQSDDLKKDIESLKESVKAIQKDVQEIKALLQSRQPAAPPQNQESVQGRAQRQTDAGRDLGLPVTVLRQARP